MTAGDLTLSVYPEGRGRSRHGTESRPLDGGGVSGGVERAQHVVTHGRVDEPPARRGEWVVMKVVGHQRRRRWVWSAARAADALRLVAVVRRRAPRFACCRSWSHRARRQRERRSVRLECCVCDVPGLRSVHYSLYITWPLAAPYSGPVFGSDLPSATGVAPGFSRGLGPATTPRPGTLQHTL